MNEVIQRLRNAGIQPTPQRIAIAAVVLDSEAHPTAEQVWETVKATSPTTSRATVYNTLNLFVNKGLLQTQVLREGTTVFDANTRAHHHFIDEDTGEIIDIPDKVLEVVLRENLDGLDIRETQVILRGRRR